MTSEEKRRVEFAMRDPKVNGRCRACQAPLVFARHPRTQNKMPLDWASRRQVPDGRWALESHFAHCPAHNRFRKEGA